MMDWEARPTVIAARASLPLNPTPLLSLVSGPPPFCFDIKKCSIILDAPPCRLPLR